MATTSTSFLLTTTPSTNFNRRKPGSTVLSKKTKDEESEGNQTGKSTSFRFNFGKLPDMKSLVPVVTTNPSTGLGFGNSRRKDPGTVFVAGATGQAGIRIAQTLLQRGFSVRAGVPDLGAAQDLARLAATYKIISKEEVKRLNAVESTFQDAESIAKAIGNATKAVVTIGATENGPNAQITTADALLVVQAAELAGVNHITIIYDNNITGSTYNVLDGITTFFNNLFAQSQTLTISDLLEKIAQIDIAYTLIKTNLTEDFSPEKSYNVVLLPEGGSNSSSNSSEAYKVPKLKIASLVADIFANIAVAENKVVEVSTDPSAQSRPVDELFSLIPEDGRRKAYENNMAKARAEEEARFAAEKAQEAAEAARELEQQVQKLSAKEAEAASLAEEAKQKAEAVGNKVDGIFNRAKDIGSGFSWDKLGSQIANTVQNATETPKVQIATIRGQTKARNLPPNKAVVKNAKLANAATAFAFKKKEESLKKPEKEVRNVFGGLFKQETIYVDDD